MIVDLNLQTSSSENKKNSKGSFVKRLRRLLTVGLTAALVLAGTVPSFAAKSADINWKDAPEMKGTSVIMIDAGSGDILYEKNSKELREPASITKIMTGLVTLENIDMDEKVTIQKDSPNVGYNIGLKKGEVFTVEQLLYAMMMFSANDAAEELAIAVGGDVPSFCKMMNERAGECGAENTNFTNPNGLNGIGQENHKTTAYDISLMAKEAMANKTFRKIVITKRYEIPATNKSDKRIIKSTNPCLKKYKNATGIKTGTTSTAGFCFCGSAKIKDTEFIVVTLNSGKDIRFEETMGLIKYGFSKYYTYRPVKVGKVAGEIKVRRGDKAEVDTGVKKDLAITLNKDYESDKIKVKTELYDKKLTAPVKKGTELGKVTAYKEGKAVASEKLYALENVEKGGILSYIGIADEERGGFFGGLAAIILTAGIIVILVKRLQQKKKRKRARRKRAVRKREWERENRPFK